MSTPGISLSGKDMPQSTIIASSPYSYTVIFLPISPSPPRGITLTGRLGTLFPRPPVFWFFTILCFDILLLFSDVFVLFVFVFFAVRVFVFLVLFFSVASFIFTFFLEPVLGAGLRPAFFAGVCARCDEATFLVFAIISSNKNL